MAFMHEPPAFDDFRFYTKPGDTNLHESEMSRVKSKPSAEIARVERAIWLVLQ
jgi:hypothetical protein